MSVCSFKKCGISVPIDGSEDSEINIIGPEDYTIGESDSEDEATDDEIDLFEDEELSEFDPFKDNISE